MKQISITVITMFIGLLFTLSPLRVQGGPALGGGGAAKRDLQFLDYTGGSSICFLRYQESASELNPILGIKTDYTNSSTSATIANGTPICLQIAADAQGGGTASYKYCTPSMTDQNGVMKSGRLTRVGISSKLIGLSDDLFITLDSDNAVNESNEANNRIHCTSFVQVPATDGSENCLSSSSASFPFDPNSSNGYEGPCPLMVP